VTGTSLSLHRSCALLFHAVLPFCALCTGLDSQDQDITSVLPQDDAQCRRWVETNYVACFSVACKFFDETPSAGITLVHPPFHQSSPQTQLFGRSFFASFHEQRMKESV